MTTRSRTRPSRRKHSIWRTLETRRDLTTLNGVRVDLPLTQDQTTPPALTQAEHALIACIREANQKLDEAMTPLFGHAKTIFLRGYRKFRKNRVELFICIDCSLHPEGGSLMPVLAATVLDAVKGSKHVLAEIPNVPRWTYTVQLAVEAPAYPQAEALVRPVIDLLTTTDNGRLLLSMIPEVGQ